MRILLLNTLYPPSQVGGAEAGVQLLAQGLASAGNNVAVGCLHDSPDTSIETDGDVGVHRFPLRNRYWPFDISATRSASDRLRWHAREQFNRAATRDLESLIDRFQPDVINTNNLTGFSTEVWRVAAARSIPIVHTIRDYSLICARSTLFSSDGHCERRCAPCKGLTVRKRHNAGLVDRVIGLTEAVIGLHREHGTFTSTPSDVIHGIAASEAPTIPAPLNAAPVFGFLGRIEVEKGIETLLEASTALGNRPHRIRVGGIGDLDYVQRLTETYRELAIDWLGHVDADEFFSTIDVLVVPPIWAEPMGRTPLEAAVRGVSVIHSDSGGVPEVALLSAKRSAFPAGDVTALTDALNHVLDNPVAWRTRHPADRSTLTTFSVDEVSGRHLAVFEQVLAQQLRGDRCGLAD